MQSALTLKTLSLAALALILPLAAIAQCPSGGTTCTGSAGTSTPLNGSFDPTTLNPNTVAANPYPMTLTIPSTATGTVTSVCVTITGLKATGASANGNGSGTQGLAMALVAPNGAKFGYFGSIGDGNNSLNGVTLNVIDSAAADLPDGVPGQDWPNSTGPFTYKPTSWANDDQDTSFPASSSAGTAAFTLTASQLPTDSGSDNQGTSTLNTAFAGAPAAGEWKLYVIDSSGGTADAITFSGGASLLLSVKPTSAQTLASLQVPTRPSPVGQTPAQLSPLLSPAQTAHPPALLTSKIR